MQLSELSENLMVLSPDFELIELRLKLLKNGNKLSGFISPKNQASFS
jgi:hypothetical protein